MPTVLSPLSKRERKVNLRSFVAALGLFVWFSEAASAEAQIVCTLIADAETGAVLIEEGDCSTRVTPASTFKVPLAVIGYDTGFLIDAGNPRLAFRSGDPDWGGANWTQDTTPERWMRFSVVWYSQRITHALGAATLERYARDLGYGNADFTGDEGFDNGLDRAWIVSSLAVSPREQVAFLRGLVNETLPVGKDAIEKTHAIVEVRSVGDWIIHGKTGAAFPRKADRSFDYSRGWGWFVGWADTDKRRIVFARLTQATERTKESPGNLTRDHLLASWPDLIARIGQ